MESPPSKLVRNFINEKCCLLLSVFLTDLTLVGCRGASVTGRLAVSSMKLLQPGAGRQHPWGMGGCTCVGGVRRAVAGPPCNLRGL